MTEPDPQASEHPTPKTPSGPLEVRENCWLVGSRNPVSLLQCNTYIRTFEGRGSPVHVCVDPGSQADYPVIEQNVEQLIGGMQEIRSFSLNHQDPDVIGNSTFVLEANPNSTLMTTEDVWRLAQHLIPRPAQIEFANPVRSQLPIPETGRNWKLVATPFCHFRGAMAFYDQELQTLFTGDLFGGLNRIGRTHLFAEEDDWNGIAQFHQIYMPTREVLRYAVRQIRALSPPVKVIAPQHGHVITGDLVEVFLDKMHELLVGHDLLAIELDDAYIKGYEQVLTRMVAQAAKTLGHREVISRLVAQADDELEQFIRVHGKDVHIDREGYTAIVKAFVRIAWREPLDFVNRLRSEVFAACTDGELPIPPIGAGLEEGLPQNFIPPKVVQRKRQTRRGSSGWRRRRN